MTTIGFFRRQTARAFDKWASYYTEDARNKLARRGYTYDQLGQMIVNYIGSNAGDVLEIGTGPGTLGPYVRKYSNGGDLIGFDIAPKMVKAARLTEAYTLTFRGNAEHLPFPENSFGALFTAFVFHSILNRRQAIDEMWRVMRGGARVVIVDLFPQRRSPFVAAVAGFFHSLGREHGAPAIYLPVASLTKELQKRGFRLVTVKPLGVKKLYSHFAVVAEKPETQYEFHSMDL